MSSDLSAELTTIATAVLAVGAIVTAVFAILAFRKQALEVGILQQQTHEHQQALEHEAIERHREQASRVWILVVPDDGISRRDFPARRPDRDPATSETMKGTTLEAMVTNASEQQQPIYNAKLHWYRGSEGYKTPEVLGAVPGYERTARSQSYPPGTDLTTCGAFLTFRDAAGYAWVRSPNGVLTEHQPDDLDFAAWKAIRALPGGPG